MFTVCPDCNTAFRLNARILKQAHGRVRCGGCGSTFNAIDHLSEELPDDEPGNTQTAHIVDERSKELLQSLDQLTGPDAVRIEDTGVEWRVLEVDDDSGNDGDPGADSPDVADNHPPGTIQWSLEQADDEPDEGRRADPESEDDGGTAEYSVHAATDLDASDESGSSSAAVQTAYSDEMGIDEDFDDDLARATDGTSEPSFAASPAADVPNQPELRYDDNTPLPDDFFRPSDDFPVAPDITENGAPPEPAEPVRDNAAASAGDDSLADLAFGDIDEWQDLLVEVTTEDSGAATAASDTVDDNDTVRQNLDEVDGPDAGDDSAVPAASNAQPADNADSLEIDDYSGAHGELQRAAVDDVADHPSGSEPRDPLGANSNEDSSNSLVVDDRASKMDEGAQSAANESRGNTADDDGYPENKSAWSALGDDAQDHSGDNRHDADRAAGNDDSESDNITDDWASTELHGEHAATDPDNELAVSEFVPEPAAPKLQLAKETGLADDDDVAREPDLAVDDGITAADLGDDEPASDALATEPADDTAADESALANAEQEEPNDDSVPAGFNDTSGDDGSLPDALSGQSPGNDELSVEMEIDQELLRAATLGSNEPADAQAGSRDAAESRLFETIIMEGDSVTDVVTESGLPVDEEQADSPENDFGPSLDIAAPAEAATPSRRLRGAGIAAAVGLALLLGLQLIHANRATLATWPVFETTLGPVYGALGNPVTPAWDVRGWRFESTTGSTDNADQRLTINSRIANKSAQALPYPLVYVSLTDRFEEIVGSRILRPDEYLAGNVSSRRPVAPGADFNAVIAIDSPAAEATGFKLNVCYRTGAQQLRCAIEDFRN